MLTQILKDGCPRKREQDSSGLKVNSNFHIFRFDLDIFSRYMPGGYRKPRKDKRKPEKFTGAQGTDVGKSETFDYSGKLAASREAAGKQASPEPQAPASGPRGQQKVQKNANKGKKKGGKKQF